MTPDPRYAGGPDEQTVLVPRGGGAPPPGPRRPSPTAHLAANQYGREFPAVEQYPGGYPVPPPPRRPASLFMALLLHLLSALPFVAGAGFVLAGGVAVQGTLPADTAAQFERLTGIAPASLFALLYGVAVAIGAVALLFVLLSLLAVARRNWARILVAVMTVPFVLVAVAWGFGTYGVANQRPDADAATIGVVLAIGAGPGALALLGTLLMFLPAANRFFARR